MYFPRVTGKCQSIVRYQGKTKQKNDKNSWNNMRGLEKDCKGQVVEGYFWVNNNRVVARSLLSRGDSPVQVQ